MTRSTDPFDEMERFFDQLTQFGGQMGGGDVPVDVLDDGEQFVVTVDLPGYTPEDIDVQLSESRRLTISAEFERSESKETGQFVRQERRRQSTSRTITLPEPVDEEATEASYDNGVLTITLQKQSSSGEGTDIPVN